jgi:hypothetical protein
VRKRPNSSRVIGKLTSEPYQNYVQYTARNIDRLLFVPWLESGVRTRCPLKEYTSAIAILAASAAKAMTLKVDPDSDTSLTVLLKDHER